MLSLRNLIDKSVKTNKQEEKHTNLSSKLSTYEDHIARVNTNKMIQPLILHVNNEQYEKITELLSKLSTYEDRLEK